VNRKFKEATSEKFTSHIAIAGNVAPEFQDNAGSIARRTVVFPFEYKAKKGDAKLGRKIQKELAYIIQACNKGYLEAVHQHDKSSIWEALPELFKITQESMAENTNALTHFLKTDLVILGKDQYCREKIFVAAFNDHCKESHFSTSKWTSQFYSGPFADFGIKLLKNQRRRYPNKPGEKTYSGSFIFGVDIKEGAVRDYDEEETTSMFD
jgi:phage/plasmid-associated DNA primase